MKLKLFEQAKKLPNKPGVYMFLGAKGVILYIGRANSLKSRTASYFRKDVDPRIAEMVGLADELKHFVTETIIDSVILEANLIKKHWPKYNVREKDDRSFVYIIIDKTDYPKPIIARGKELNKFPTEDFFVFGPFKSFKIARDILRIARKFFHYSACKPLSGKPCFHYQLGLCPGVCVGAISKKDYGKIIDNLVMFLSGDKKRLIKKLKKEDPSKAVNLKYMQDVALLEKGESCKADRFNRIEGYDISHFAGKESYGAMAVFENGHENKNEYRLFKIKEAPANDDLRALEEVIVRRFNHKEWRRPDLILIDGGRPQILHIRRVLNGAGIIIPVVGISKLNGDKLVFPAGTKKSFQELAEASKNLFLRIRDEAHRFANFARKRKSALFPSLR